MTKELRMAIEVILTQLNKTPKKVLEIGSRAAINQEQLCDLRPLLPKSSYIGVDMQSGVGVDVVADATDLPFANATFDLVICLETLEHAIEPWKLVKEINRVVKKSGAVILSSQQNFPIHMHPSDYFRYTPYGIATLLPHDFERLVMGISPPFDDEVSLNPKHVIGVAWRGAIFDKNQLKNALHKAEPLISGHKPYRHRIAEAIKLLRRAISEIFFRQEIKFFE